MDLREKERFGLEKKSVGSLSCHTSSLATAEWNQIGSVSLVDSFDDGLWNQPSNTHSSTFGKPVRLSWNPSSSHTKGGMFITDGPQMHPLALSHVPSDSGFIERAARFSCFGGAVNPFAFSEVPNSIAGRVEAFNDRSNSECAMKDQGEKGNNEFSELEFNGEAQEEPTNSSKGVIAAKKRKRSKQGMELDQSQAAAQSPCEAAKDDTDTKKEQKNSSTMATVTPSGKNSKESVETPKEDYIHVRARRGQATNSHSLAERVRRERISERMKFLQYLVPGCSKVTGKAVMLDEIINYVQSLQRQVEFLSMKLAAVNPRMDYHVEGLPSKNLFQNRGGSSSSTIGFSHDMIHHQLHPPHQSLIQVGMHGVINPLEAFRRAPNVQLPSTSGFKDATQQVPNALEDHLQNVLHMTYGNNPALKTQDLNGVPGDAFTL